MPGVDTKFIEHHRGVLGELLDLQLAPDRIDADATDFAGRYRFRRKPGYVRFRAPGFCGFSELSVRAGEFAAPPPGTRRAYVVENEITYLAFPLPGGAIVIFGGGYAVDVLEPLGWLTNLDLIYWGDIDTHGFAILNRLRHRFSDARSMLMDRATLLAHRDQWVTEPRPAVARLELLGRRGSDPSPRSRRWQPGPSVRLERLQSASPLSSEPSPASQPRPCPRDLRRLGPDRFPAGRWVPSPCSIARRIPAQIPAETQLQVACGDPVALDGLRHISLGAQHGPGRLQQSGGIRIFGDRIPLHVQ